MSWNLRAFGETKSFYGEAIRLDIYENGYTGTAAELMLLGLQQTVDSESDDHFVVTAGQRLSISIRKSESQPLNFLFTSQPQGLKVVLTVAAQVKFVGWMVHDGYKQTYEDRSDIELVAICGIGNLKLSSFYLSANQTPSGWISCWQVLTACLSYINLGIPLKNYSNLYELQFSKSVEPLLQVGASITTFLKGKPDATFTDVLEAYLKPFGQLRQHDGYWMFFPWETYKRGMVGREYDASYLFVDACELEDSVSMISALDYDNANGVVFRSVPSLELRPMLRSLSVEQEAAGSNNILDAMSMWNKAMWNDTTNSLRMVDVPGASNGKWIDFIGYYLMSDQVVPDTFELSKSATFSFPIEKVDAEVSASFKFLVSNMGHPPADSAPWGIGVVIQLMSNTEVKFLTEDGWSGEAADALRIVSAETVGFGQSITLSYKAYNLPFNGTLSFTFYIKFQHEFVACRLEETKFTVEQSIDANYTRVYPIKPINQTEQKLSFRYLDMPVFANSELFYRDYYTLASGQPTASWQALPDLASQTLMEHVHRSVFAKRSAPLYKLEGDCYGPIAPMTVIENTIDDGKSYMITRATIDYVDSSVNGITMVELPGYAAPGSSNYIQLENSFDIELENGEPLELEDSSTEPETDFEKIADFVIDARYAISWNGAILIGGKYGVIYTFDGTTVQELVSTYTGMVECMFVDSANKLWIGCTNNSGATGPALFSFTQTTGLKREADLPNLGTILAIGEFNSKIYVVHSKDISSVYSDNHVYLSRLELGALVQKQDNYETYKDKSIVRQHGVVVEDGNLLMFQGNYYFLVKDGVIGTFTFALALPTSNYAHKYVSEYNSSRWRFWAQRLIENGADERYNAGPYNEGPIAAIGDALWLMQKSSTHVYKNGAGTKLNYVPPVYEYVKDQWKSDPVAVCAIGSDVYRINRNHVYKFVGVLP